MCGTEDQADTVRRLEDENERLRIRLADLSRQRAWETDPA